MRPPPLVRTVSGVAALGVAILFLWVSPGSWAARGCTWTGAATAAAALPLVAFLALLALRPEAVAPLVRRFTRVDFANGGHVAALLILATALAYILGGTLVTAVATIEPSVHAACADPATAPSADPQRDLLVGVGLSFLVFTLPILVYVAIVHDTGPHTTFALLGLHQRGAARAIAIGALVAIAFLLVVYAATYAAARFLSPQLLDNPRALEIAQSLTPVGALLVALASSLGEELFFRGFLQPRVGLWATAALFAFAHVSYASVSEVVVVFALALVLGVLYRRTGNLLAPLATHFTFNLVNLMAGLYATS